MKKKDLGQYFTQSSVWLKPQIQDFIISSGVSSVLDPFCGQGDLLKVAEDLGFINCIGYDIDASLNWEINDSLNYIKETDALILTNPPYLAKNSAKRRKSPSYKYFEGNTYSDLYLIAIDRILNSAEKAVAIIPESFLQTGLFHDRLHSITVIEDNPFSDTECPICVACFDEKIKSLNRVSLNGHVEYSNPSIPSKIGLFKKGVCYCCKIRMTVFAVEPLGFSRSSSFHNTNRPAKRTSGVNAIL